MTPINGWKVSWTWPGNQQMTQSWNATYVQTANSVTLTNMSYNPAIAAGAAQSGIGFWAHTPAAIRLRQSSSSMARDAHEKLRLRPHCVPAPK